MPNDIHPNPLEERGLTIDASDASRLVSKFRAARRKSTTVVLEGLHPLKHALRFGAIVDQVVTGDRDLLAHLCKSLASDVSEWILDHAVTVDRDVFTQLAPVPPDTGVIAIAKRRDQLLDDVLAAPRAAPFVLLENPSHLGNMGTAIRSAAGAGAAGVITIGPQNPWHPTAVRGAAGLQYALPVVRVDTFPTSGNPTAGPLVGIHPEGEHLRPGSIPSDALLVFGSERRGLSKELLARVDQRLAIPMEPGISSLNLATAVAVTLYTWRLWPIK